LHTINGRAVLVGVFNFLFTLVAQMAWARCSALQSIQSAITVKQDSLAVVLYWS
jgi:hypothetical protein